MTGNYEKLIHNNLDRLYKKLPKDLGLILPANRKGDSFIFEAFGEECRIRPEGINLGGTKETGVPGVLISLYVLNVGPEPSVLQPLKAFKDFSASATCLFSNNAYNFLPLDALADVGEYTSRKIIQILA